MPIVLTYKKYLQIVGVLFGFLFIFATLSHADGIAMHGAPALKKNFSHFPYTNLNAPQGGSVTYGVVGTFDGLNPFVLTSLRTTARGLFADPLFGNLVFEGLMARSYDEPFTLYSLLAKHVDLSPDRKMMTVVLDPSAKFSDGVSVTADDVVFTYQLLKDQGRIPFSLYLKQIVKLEKIDDRTLVYYFKQPVDRELPLIIASVIPVLPRHAVNLATFSQNGLTIIPGTGPYIIKKVEPGERIIYKRNPSYWGKNLPVNKGQNNFDEIRIEYFRNYNACFEAFKKGILNVFIEEDPNRWRKGYNFPAVKSGSVIKESFRTQAPSPMNAFVFNTRRPIFANQRVRQALSEVFDFEWMNRNLFNNVYRRTSGFWSNSLLSSVGRPASDKELALLAPFPNSVRPDVLAGTWHPFAANGTGLDRDAAEHAWTLLQNAGFRWKNQKAIGPDGKRFTFEIMTQSAGDEKVALAFQRSLKRLGIDVTVRTVDDTQYQNRLGTFDYDVIIAKLSASLSPGNEQISRWSSGSRNIDGSFNYAGAQDPAIDAVIKAMLNAKEEDDFIAAVRALDRILISGNYFIPLYHLPNQWVARWNIIGHPEKTPITGFRLSTWWHTKTETDGIPSSRSGRKNE